ncbi:Sir2 histone deacetylase Hst2 [Polyrhizophydium stewartii]|uniref:Sir2 histone deacetylase Hst2 n=1 Tax=Polyrhizophydium stewartii TaxID=2732419 RepID=A0ABR4N8S7_9FUNG|nr:NAD-dependent protein deacetylase sirtuin-2 [Polyrhizophydium stewartii]
MCFASVFMSDREAQVVPPSPSTAAAPGAEPDTRADKAVDASPASALAAAQVPGATTPSKPPRPSEPAGETPSSKSARGSPRNSLGGGSSRSSPSGSREGRPPPTERRLLTPFEEKEANPKLNILPDSTLESFAAFVRKNKCSNIIVMTGAGISTSAGIPDFRTPGTGLYDNLAKYKLPYPEAIFDIAYFRRKPEAFNALSRELFPGQFQPTACHRFIKALEDAGMLLRNYTQNIDMLERIAGVDGELLVEAHGTFHGARCVGGITSGLMSVFTASEDEGQGGDESSGGDGVVEEDISPCGRTFTLDAFKAALDKDKVPRCPCGGLMKPDIVFFGEPLPERFGQCAARDFSRCDALVVMGTSLKVQPFCNLINFVGPTVPRLLINLEECGVSGQKTRGFDFVGDTQKYRRDALFLGTCDAGVEALARELGIAIPPPHSATQPAETAAVKTDDASKLEDAADALADEMGRVKL